MVTGDSQGIGYGVASALVKAGAAVVITGRTEATLEQARAQLTALRTDALVVALVVALVADGKDPETASRVVERATAEFGRLDVLVNNAQQVVPTAPVEAIEIDDIEVTFQSGLFATWRYMVAAYPDLREAHGTVINFGSGVAVTGMTGYGAYAANKEAVRGLSRVAAREWGPHGVTVNVIHPLVRTQHTENQPPEIIDQMLRSFPLQRFGDRERNIGGLVLFLASEEGSFITGSTFDMDGGAFMRP